MVTSLAIACPVCGVAAFTPDPHSRYGVRPLDPRAAVRVNGISVLARCGACQARWKLGEVSAEPAREPEPAGAR